MAHRAVSAMREWCKMQVTTGRTLAFVYTALVVAVAIFGFGADRNPTDGHYVAARDMGENTLLTDEIMKAKPGQSVEDRLRLASEHAGLVRKYLAEPVRKDDRLAPDKVLPWPDLAGLMVVPVGLSAAPDLKMMNRGTEVELSIGDDVKRATVLAVVLSEEKWYALFRQSDVGNVVKKEVKVGRILSLPAPLAATTPQPPPNPPAPKSPAQRSP